MSVNDISNNGEITRKEFKKSLKDQNVSKKTVKEAVTIFEKYDTAPKDKTLNAQELAAAKNELETLGINIGENGTVTYTESSTGTVSPDAAKTQEKPEQPKDENIPSETNGDPKKTAKEPTFVNDNAAKIGVYRYLLNNNDSLSNDDLSNIQNNDVQIGHATSQDNGKIYFVQYGGKYYRVTTNSEGKTEILEDSSDNYTNDGNGNITFTQKTTVENPQTLMKAVLDAASTDNKHNYVNRHGKAGNNKSVYNGTTIQNTSTNRQHVNPVQTFTSMLLNNDEDSRVTFNNNLSGKDVIDVVLAGQTNRTEHKDEISLNDLIRYLNATISEAAETVKDKKGFGTRTAAKDVDMDMKDMANIGAIFKKYAGDDGYLNKDELDKLIADLTNKNNSTTSLARQAYKENSKPTEPTKPTPQPETDPNKKTKLEANRTRHIAGTKKGDKNHDVKYHYEDGMRTIVDDEGFAVTNANIAEYKDHGVLGAGRKDFIRIEGLPANINAKVVDGKPGDKQIKIKVKAKKTDGKGKETKYYIATQDANGNYQVDYNKPVDKKEKIK